MFADIPGFASWSLAREPSQVFTLLESIYAEFDRLAHRRKVFKVEVVGDCYVVSGSQNSFLFSLPTLSHLVRGDNRLYVVCRILARTMP